MLKPLLSICLAAMTAAACSSTTTPSAPSRLDAGSGTTSVPSPDPIAAATTARYRATFRATWSGATHPVDFPASAHFSPLVGGTHNTSVTFWREGAIATDGIRDMAERGLTATLSNEISLAVSAGTAERVFTGGNIGDSPGTATAEFAVSQQFPRVTLVSMIAPSPDWFVGVSALPLFDNGQWIDETRIDLIPWDAGTDSGATFMSPDQATLPRIPISRIVAAPLSPSGRVTPLGTFTFTRLP
jgi:hypothetical protein